MIPLNDPATLPIAVRALRESRGWSRQGVARKVAASALRTDKTIQNQWHAWEAGVKSPLLLSLGLYLRAHGVRLGLLLPVDRDDSPWCPARSRESERRRCAVAAGHGGRHRDYASNEFR